MSFWHAFFIFLILTFTFNITEFECTPIGEYANRTFHFDPGMAGMITEFPLGISDVFDDASDVFRKIIGNMVSKKRLIGLDSGWYW